MKKLSILLVLLLIPVIISGCSDSVENDKKVYNTGEGNLKVMVQWDNFNNMKSQKISNNLTLQNDNNLQVTHTGARVVYEKDNASFTQRVERNTAKEEGIITFKIPSTDNANLYTVAVHNSQEYKGNRALFLGIKENIQIPNEGIIEISMGDINWIKASWYPYDNYKNFEDGLTANNDKEEYIIPIYVREPIQIKKTPRYDSLYIKINGYSSPKENPDGWRTFHISNENSGGKAPHTETYNFQPYVSSTKFNLPTENGRYFIKPMVEDYEIKWE